MIGVVTYSSVRIFLDLKNNGLTTLSNLSHKVRRYRVVTRPGRRYQAKLKGLADGYFEEGQSGLGGIRAITLVSVQSTISGDLSTLESHRRTSCQHFPKRSPPISQRDLRVART